MGKHLWISSDETITFDDGTWITTSNVFNIIFNRVATFFRNHELTCKDKCFEERGMDGIYLDVDVDKDCFNIFYLRCNEALTQYPDEQILTWLEQFPNQPEKRDGYINGVIGEWREILKRLELDKRYDARWIEDYRHRLGKVEG